MTNHILSKSRFVAGWQCHKLLWWTVNEPDAKELQPDKVLQDLFDQGRQVGEVARRWFPGGVLIERRRGERADSVAETKQALDAGAPTIFEASFEAGGVHVAVDVLERVDGGFRLTEVKSATSQKDEHLPDVAIQVHVAEAADVPIREARVIHLNKEFRHPDEGELLARADVTEAVRELLPRIPPAVAGSHLPPAPRLQEEGRAVPGQGHPPDLRAPERHRAQLHPAAPAQGDGGGPAPM